MDLIGIFLILWTAKQQLLISICCFTLTGLLVSFLLPQKWTSNAIVTSPEPTQWSHLYQSVAALQVSGIDVRIDRDDVFNLFLKKFSSQQELEKYIISSPPLMARYKDSNVDTMALRRAIVDFSEKMKALNDRAGKKDTPQPYNSWTLSFSGVTPQEAQSILNNYIDFVAGRVVAQTLEGVRNTVALKVQTEQEALELERAKLTNLHNTSIKRLNYSLQVAEAAGIIRPVYSSGQVVHDDPDFSITLGASGIKRKLEILKSIRDISELIPDLHNREYQLSLMKEIRVKDFVFPVFKYQLAPSLPVKKDSPGTLVVVVLAVLLGGIFTCGSILLSHAIAQRSL